jgi:hypothetical protein
MHHQITTIMKKSIRTAITIFLFPIWFPMLIVIGAWFLAIEIGSIIVDYLGSEQ